MVLWIMWEWKKFWSRFKLVKSWPRFSGLIFQSLDICCCVFLEINSSWLSLEISVWPLTVCVINVWFFSKPCLILVWVFNMLSCAWQTLYDSVYLTLYNICFTSLPILVYSLFEQLVHPHVLQSKPALYRYRDPSAAHTAHLYWDCQQEDLKNSYLFI